MVSRLLPRLTATLLRETSHPFFLVAGPCVVESMDHSLIMADRLAEIGARLKLTTIFKSSFDKANRQSLSSFRGPGLDAGLEVLQRVKDQTGCYVLTDVHETGQVDTVAEVADCLQIPALLCRQTDLIVAAAQSGRLVAIKKGQFASAHTAVLASQKALTAAGPDAAGVILTERGTTFGYDDLVVDPRNLHRMMKRSGIRGGGGGGGGGGEVLVMQDVTHSVQRPGPGWDPFIDGNDVGDNIDDGMSGNDRGDRDLGLEPAVAATAKSVGCPEYVPVIARMAAAVGVNGLFFEVHDRPSAALCDGSSMLPLDQLEPLLEELIDIAMASRARDALKQQQQQQQQQRDGERVDDGDDDHRVVAT